MPVMDKSTCKNSCIMSSVATEGVLSPEDVIRVLSWDPRKVLADSTPHKPGIQSLQDLGMDQAWKV